MNLVSESIDHFKRGQDPKKSLELGGDTAKLAILRRIESPKIRLPRAFQLDEIPEYDKHSKWQYDIILDHAFKLEEFAELFLKWCKKIKRSPSVWIGPVHHGEIEWISVNDFPCWQINGVPFATKADSEKVAKLSDSLRIDGPKDAKPHADQTSITLDDAIKLMKNHGIS